MAKIHFDITGDNSNLVSTLNDTTARMEKFSSLMKDLGSAGFDMSNPKAQLKSLSIAIRDNEIIIHRYKQELQELARAQKEAASKGDVESVKAFGEKMAVLGERTQSVITETNQLKAAHNELSNSLKKSGGVMESFLGGADNYTRIINQLPPGLRNVTMQLNAMTGAAKAFIATPLGLILAGLVVAYQALTTWLTQTADGQMVLAAKTGYLNGVLATLGQTMKDLGADIYRLFSEPKQAAEDLLKFLENQFIVRFKAFMGIFTESAKLFVEPWRLMFNKGSYKDLFESWGNILGNIWGNILQLGTGASTDEIEDFANKLDEAGKKGEELGIRMEELRRKRSAWGVQEAKIDREVAELRNKMYTGSTEERAEAAAKAEELINRKYAKRIEFAKEEYRIQVETNKLAENSQEEIDARNRKEEAIIREQAAREGELRIFTRRGHSADEAGIKAEQRAQDALTALILQNEEKRIAMIENEGEREAEAINLRYKKALAEIAKTRREWEEQNRINKGDSTLSTEQANALAEAERLAGEEMADAQKKSTKALLDEYKGYWQQRQDILENGIREALELEAAGEEEAANNRRRETARQLNALDRQNKEVYKKLAKDRSEWLVGDISALLAGLQQELDSLIEEDNPDIETIQRLRREIESLKKELSQSFTPSGILKSLLAPDEEGNGKSFLQRIKDLKSAWDKMTAEQKWKVVGGYVAKIGQGLQKAADYMNQIAELTGNSKLSDTAEELNAVAQNFIAAGQGAAQGGWIGAIVGGVSDMLTQTIEAFTNAGLQEAIATKNANDWADAIERMALAVNSADFDTIFGTKAVSRGQAKYKEAIGTIGAYEQKLAELESQYGNQQIDKYARNSLGATIFGQGLGVLIGAPGLEFLGLGKNKINNAFKEYENAISKGYTGLQRMLVTTKKQTGWAKFWGAQDEYTALGDLAPELWKNGELNLDAAKKLLEVNTQLTDEQKKQIQNLIDLKEGYDEAMKAVDDTISETFGSLASDVTDIIWDSVMTGADAWDKFKDIGADAIASLGKQLIQEMMISEYLEQFRDRMRAAYQSDSPQETQEKLRSVVTDIFSGLQGAVASGTLVAQEWKAWAEQQGFDLAKLSRDTQNVTAGAFQTMSQDTANELNGRFTALQLSNEIISQSAQAGIEFLSTISAVIGTSSKMVGEIRDLHILEVGYLEDISKYTKTMVGFGEKLDKIEQNTSKL